MELGQAVLPQLFLKKKLFIVFKVWMVTEKNMGKILSLENVTKKYPGVVALNKVSFDVEEGEVHALIGENGAGKSTLIKTITGAITPDEGSIIYKGKKYAAMTPGLSGELGIEAIYQEFNLADSLSVAENIFMGTKVGSGPFVDFNVLYKKADEVLSAFNVNISSRSEIRDLTVAYKQLVEIAKAVAKDAKLLIMDEPTAPLTDDEVEILFQLIEKLKKNGVTIIYISHRLDELFRVADRLTVMRDGEVIVTKKVDEINKEQLIYYMVGRELKETYPPRNHSYGDVVLEVKELCGNGVLPVSFSVRQGEILGLAGLVGAGRTELARLIFGAERADGGEIRIEGKKADIRSPKDAVKYGIGYVSEDRKSLGSVLSMSIRWNITLPILERISRFGFINRDKEKTCVEKYKDSLRIKTPSLDQLVGNLSGGNQQKVVLSKWLASEAKVLILDEPTRGIDVGSKHEIYQLINRLSEQGMAIIIISSEMEEIIGMTDRMLVLAEGRTVGELQKSDFSQETILRYASGEK